MSIIHTGSTARAKPELSGAVSKFASEGQNYIADLILPTFSSQVDSGTINVINREDMLTHESTERAPGTTYARGNIRTSAETFTCKVYGHEEKLPDEIRAMYATAFDAELVATRKCTEAILIDREIRVKNLIMNTTTWTGAALYTDVSSAPWDAAASGVIAHVQAAKEKVRRQTGMEANSLILSKVQADNLLTNTGIIARFPGAAMVTMEMLKNNLAAIFGLEQLIIGGGVYNSAGEGQSATITDIWSDDYAMVAKLATPGSGLTEDCLGRTIQWTGLSGDGIDVRVYREEQTDSDVIKAKSSMVEKIIDTACGHLLKVDA